MDAEPWLIQAKSPLMGSVNGKIGPYGTKSVLLSRRITVPSVGQNVRPVQPAEGADAWAALLLASVNRLSRVTFRLAGVPPGSCTVTIKSSAVGAVSSVSAEIF